MSIVVTITCALFIMLCYHIDTDEVNVRALHDYISYSRQCIDIDENIGFLQESCSTLLRNDSIYKSNPDNVPAVSFNTVEEMEEFVDGWAYADSHKINPYINAYIKQSLWEYADWCINEDSDDYWHMKYIASQKTGSYNYARQIKYKWYKIGYQNAPILVVIALFTFVFANVLCVLYGLSGVTRKKSVTFRGSTGNTNDSSDCKKDCE